MDHVATFEQQQQLQLQLQLVGGFLKPYNSLELVVDALPLDSLHTLDILGYSLFEECTRHGGRDFHYGTEKYASAAAYLQKTAKALEGAVHSSVV